MAFVELPRNSPVDQCSTSKTHGFGSSLFITILVVIAVAVLGCGAME